MGAMTFKTDSAPLLCLSERCVWFHSHLWIETAELISANTLAGSKSLILSPVYCLNLMYDLEKNLATYSMLLEDMRHFIAFWKSCVNLKLDRSPEKLEGISSMLLTALCSYSPEMHNLGHDNKRCLWKDVTYWLTVQSCLVTATKIPRIV